MLSMEEVKKRVGVKWVRLRRINRDYIVSGSKWWSARQTTWLKYILICYLVWPLRWENGDVLKGPPRRARERVVTSKCPLILIVVICWCIILIWRQVCKILRLDTRRATTMSKRRRGEMGDTLWLKMFGN